MKKFFILSVIVTFAAFTACAKGSKPTEDTGTDPDIIDNTPADTDVDTTDTVGDDVAVDDTGPDTCSGPDTLTIEFTDRSDNPVSGIPVALRCAGDFFEATSDASGRVSFSNLDLENIPVDLTYIHDNMARTVLGLGGSRTVPDPFPITVGEEEEEEEVRIMRGNVVHNQADSYVIVTTDIDVDIIILDNYELRSPVGTGLPMSVLEYTSTGATANFIGYSLFTYDTPPEGTNGPEASAAACTFQNVSVLLNFELRGDSPMRNRLLASDDPPYPNRAYAGIRMWAADADENAWLAGLTTNWNKGDSSDTLEFGWALAGLESAADAYPSAFIADPNFMYYVGLQLPDDPSTWSSFTVHDTPWIPGLSPSTPIPFDHIITVDHPDWAKTISYHIRLSSGSGVLGNTEFIWSVLTHPETASFSFAKLPWPSSISYSDIIPPLTLFVGVSGVAYDADPYENYILWTDDEWGTEHYQSAGVDSRFLIDRP